MNKFFRLFAIAFLSSLTFSQVAIAQDKDSLTKAILTPKPAPTPRINGPKLFGVRPNHPIVYTVPVSGDRPMKYAAKNLPKGVKLDKKTGKLSGSIAQAGARLGKQILSDLPFFFLPPKSLLI